MLISLSLIVAASCQVEIPGGQCTPVPLMPNFELNKYAGLWYEQIKYPFRNSVELGGKCVTATYTGIDDISVSVNNSIIYPDENDQFYLSSVLGTGVQLEPEIAGNKLYVCINQCREGDVPETTYNVMDTDYENYAIVYITCEDMGDYVVELYYILSRSQDFKKTDMYEEVVQKAVEEFGFRRELANETPQEDCEFDYVFNKFTTTTTTTTTNSTTTTTATTTTSNLALYPVLSQQLLIIVCYISALF